MGVLDRGDGGERRLGRLLDLLAVRGRLVLARQREVHDHGAAVLRDGLGAVLGVERTLDVADALDLTKTMHAVHLRTTIIGERPLGSGDFAASNGS